MLRFVVHAAHRLTLLPYLQDWAGELAPRIELVGYDELFHASRLPLCTHVFTDLDRLSPSELESAALVWRALEQAPAPVKLLNHPLRAMRRYELLRTLRERGRNDFDVYRLTEVRTPARYPVFLRIENAHLGPESELLSSPAELDAALETLCAQGLSREARLAVEYRAAAAPDGLFRKYGVFYVDGEVIPRHVLFSREWFVKGRTKHLEQRVLDEEEQFLETNPDAQSVAEIFRIARIDYGRIDYSWVDGRLQTYEINLNPTVISAGPPKRTRKKTGFTQALTRAFERLEAESPEGAGLHPRRFRPSAPLRNARARLMSRVCRTLLGRQLRESI